MKDTQLNIPVRKLQEANMLMGKREKFVKYLFLTGSSAVGFSLFALLLLVIFTLFPLPIAIFIGVGAGMMLVALFLRMIWEC